MPEQPTIWDILGYEQEGGQTDMMSYLSDLLIKSQGEDGVDLSMGGFGQGYEEDVLKDFLSNISQEDFRNMSEDELKVFIRDYTVGEGVGGRMAGKGLGGAYLTNPETGELSLRDDWEDMFELTEGGHQGSGLNLLNYAQQLQEGFMATPTSESFGLDRKIGDIETTGERELKSAREGYIPGEILSRYGALQGKAGAQQKGEQLEQAYTEDIYGVQRGMGRDVRSTYEDFEDEWFGGVESWIGGLG